MEESGVGARGSYSAWLGFQGRLDVRAVDVTAETRGSGSCGACTDAEAGAGARGCSSMAAASGSDLLLGLGRRGRCLLGLTGRDLGQGGAGPRGVGVGSRSGPRQRREGGGPALRVGPGQGASRPVGPRALVGLVWLLGQQRERKRRSWSPKEEGRLFHFAKMVKRKRKK